MYMRVRGVIKILHFESCAKLGDSKLEKVLLNFVPGFQKFTRRGVVVVVVGGGVGWWRGLSLILHLNFMN